MTHSRLKVSGFSPTHLSCFLEHLSEMGVQLEIGTDFVVVKSADNLKPVNLQTEPYPGFPTDLQAQMIALMTVVDGCSQMTENIFENRFMHVPELCRLGASISLDGKTALIQGGGELKGASVMCTDLRASAALILSALVSQGTTEIKRIYHLERGYENIEQKLRSLGVEIIREKDRV